MIFSNNFPFSFSECLFKQFFTTVQYGGCWYFFFFLVRVFLNLLTTVMIFWKFSSSFNFSEYFWPQCRKETDVISQNFFFSLFYVVIPHGQSALAVCVTYCCCVGFLATVQRGNQQYFQALSVIVKMRNKWNKNKWQSQQVEQAWKRNM